MPSGNELYIKFLSDIEDLRKDIDSIRKDVKKMSGTVNRQVESMSTKLAKFGLALNGVQQGFRTIYQLGRIAFQPGIAAASDAVEIGSKFDVVFGKNKDRVREWAKEFGDAETGVGRSRLELEMMLSTLQDTLVPMGLERDAAADLSMELTELAVDVASFNNAMDADVIRDFQSALVGNHETVRKYGIVITEATLQQSALESGIISTKRQLTEQEKIQARINLLFAGTTDAQGDARRTADSFANTLKRARALGADLLVLWGQKLIPKATEFFELMIKGGSWLEANFNQVLASTAIVLQDVYTITMTLAGAVGGYLLVTKSLVVWQKLQVLWVNRAAIAQKGLNVVMKANPIGLVVGLLASLLGALMSVEGGFSAIKDVFMAFWSTTRDVFQNFWSIVKLVFFGLSTPLRFAYNLVKEFATGFKNIFASMGDIVKGFWKIITGDFEDGWEMLKSGVNNLGVTLKTSLTTAIEETADPVNEALANIDFSDSEEAWEKAGKNVAKAFKGGFTTEIEETPPEVPGGTTGSEPDFAGTDGSLKKTKETTDEIKDLVKSTESASKNLFIGMVKDASDWASATKSFIDNISDAFLGYIWDVHLAKIFTRKKEDAVDAEVTSKEVARAGTRIAAASTETGVQAAKGAAKYPFPANIILIAGAIATVMMLINSLKSRAKKMGKFGKGGAAKEPMLALFGEVPGVTELFAPQPDFIRYATETLTPMIQAQVEAKIGGAPVSAKPVSFKSPENSAVVDRLDRVEKAIRELRFPSESGIAKAVTNRVRGRLN